MNLFLRSFLAILFLAATFTPAGAKGDGSSANSDNTTYYMELVGSINPTNGNTAVTVNIGKMLTSRVNLTPAELSRVNRDQRYVSMSDAMNALSQRGWRLVDTYTVSTRGMSKIYWVVAKDVEDPHELLDGFLD